MRLLAFFNSAKKYITKRLDTNDQVLVTVLWGHVPFYIKKLISSQHKELRRATIKIHMPLSNSGKFDSTDPE